MILRTLVPSFLAILGLSVFSDTVQAQSATIGTITLATSIQGNSTTSVKCDITTTNVADGTYNFDVQISNEQNPSAPVSKTTTIAVKITSGKGTLNAPSATTPPANSGDKGKCVVTPTATTGITGSNSANFTFRAGSPPPP